VLFTSTSVILQFLNCLVSPSTFLTVTLLVSVLAYITSLNTVFPFRITLNSHIIHSSRVSMKGLAKL